MVLFAAFLVATAAAQDLHTNAVYNVTFSLPGQLQTSFPVVDVPRYQVERLWSIEPSNAPGALITPDGANQRTIAYNPHVYPDELYLVSRSSPTESNYVIYILDAASGTNSLRDTNGTIAMLSTDDIYNGGAVGEGGIGIASLAVADDGAIYGCNMTVDACGCGPNAGANPSDSLFRLYRWANSGSNTQPVQVFQGDPASLGIPMRWGDTLAARGSGKQTQILVDSADGKYVALLTPTDNSLTNFVPTWFTNGSGVTPLGRSLEFVGPTNFVQKGKGDSVRKAEWDTNNNTFTVTGSIRLASTLGQLSFDGAGEGAAIDFIGTAAKPDNLSIYDFLSSSPGRIASTNFPTAANPNPEFAGKVLFRFSYIGKQVWALDANRGLISLLVNGPRTVQVQTAVPGHVGNTELITAIGKALGSNNPSGTKLIYKITGIGTSNGYGGFFLREGTNDLDIPQYISAKELSAVLAQTVNSKNMTNAVRYAVSSFSISTPMVNLSLQGLLTEKFAGPGDSTNGLANPALQSAIASSLDGGGYVGAGYVAHGSAVFSGRKLEVGPNQLPAVSLTSPGDGQQFFAGNWISLRASASAPDGVALVEFFQDGNKVGESTSIPFTFLWTNAPTGTLGISAKATSGDGASAYSNTNTITVR